MENDAEKKPIEEKVFAAIESGKVKMRPKWLFAFRGALYATGAILVFLTILYLVSFQIFILRQNGVLAAPGFGWRGWYEFFFSLPWLLMLFICIFLVILEILVRHYSFAYRRPLLYSLLIIFFIVTFGSVAVERTQLHRRLADFADRDELPVAGQFYRNFGSMRIKNIHRGIIESLNSDGFNIQVRRRETEKVIISEETKLPPDSSFVPGKIVVIFGPEDDDHVVRALGVLIVGE